VFKIIDTHDSFAGNAGADVETNGTQWTYGRGGSEKEACKILLTQKM
jgi:hypothetical protein